MEDTGYDNTGNTNEQAVYRECLRNHAANLGSYATDGCGEFSLGCSEGGAGGTTADLHCAACGCHRSFHRKVMKPKRQHLISSSVSPLAHHDNTITRNSSAQQMVNKNDSNSNKRVRTKFTADQKQKMLVFAEKLGWRLQRSKDHHVPVSDDEIQRFCRGIGVSRQAFKVWMHNHKSLSSTSSSSTNNNINSSLSTGNASSLIIQ